MIYLFLVLVSFNSFAQQGWFPFEKPNAENVYVSHTECESKEGFICYDIAICETVEVCEFVDLIGNGSPIYDPKENILECTEEECKALVDHCKAFPEHQFFYAATSIGLGYEAYCSKVVGYNQIVIGKKLQNSPTKIAKAEKDKKDKEDLKIKKAADKIAAKAAIKAASTIAQLRKAMEDYILSIE